MLQLKLSKENGEMGKNAKSGFDLLGMTMMQCSKESMNYWHKLEPSDENVSRLFCDESN